MARQLRSLHLFCAMLVAAALLGAGTATGNPGGGRATPDREARLSPAVTEVGWDGEQRAIVEPGASSTPRTGEESCTKEPGRYCDVTLLHVDVDPSFWKDQGGGAVVTLTADPDGDGLIPHEVHTYVWRSDAEGNALGRFPIGPHGGLYTNRPQVATVIPEASGYYRIEAKYVTTTSDEPIYAGKVKLRTHPLLPPDGTSLPAVSSGARPGPDVLYEPPPRAPQLENRNPRFQALPLLVSGTEAYMNGEYLYQDYIYDDWGSDTNGSVDSGGTCFDGRKQDGDVLYPTNHARYGGNAADLVEFRISVAGHSVAYRITLNTLFEPDSTIAVIAFDTDDEAATGGKTLPLDAGAAFPGTDEVITTWGTGARHDRWSGSGWATTPLETPTTDLDASQITMVVPRTVSDPRGVWRATVAVGLYDNSTAGGGWLLPGQSPDTTTPGGAHDSPDPSAKDDPYPSGIFNLAFRFDEPVTRCPLPPDTNQSEALRNHDPTRYANLIYFAQLDDRLNRVSIPSAGYQMRIFPSRLDLGEGRDLKQWPSLRGQLQPYTLYVPTGPPAGLTLLLHGATVPAWGGNGLEHVRVAGELRDNLVALPHSRIAAEGVEMDGWWRNEGEYDVFEVWNDVASHFRFPADRATLAGSSGGGYGAYRLGTLYPDLFGKVLTLLGPPGEGAWVPPAPPSGARPIGGPDGTGMPETLTNLWLENARNLPFMNVVIATDELVPFAGPRAQNLGAPELSIKGFNDHRYRFRFLVYDGGEHLGFNAALTPFLAADDFHIPQAVVDFLGDGRVNREPSHVTFAYVPAADEPGRGADDPTLGLRHDHAYWVSELDLARRDTPAGARYPAKGVIDVLSHAFGQGDPTTAGFGDPPGVDGTPTGLFRCTPGQTPGCGPLLYTEYSRSWDEAAMPPNNRLTGARAAGGGHAPLTLTNLAGATIDARRAGLDLCRPIALATETDTQTRLTLAGPLIAASVTGAAFEQADDGVVLLLEPGIAAIEVTPACGMGKGSRRVTGAGAIPGASGGTASFSLGVFADRDGGVAYRDEGAGVHFRSTEIRSVSFDDAAHSVTIVGLGTSDGADVGFTVAVTDVGEPGGQDRFTITLTGDDGYSNTGTLVRGNAQVH
jgi:hypothetical protein